MIIRPEAEADLAGAKQWYEGQKEVVSPHCCQVA
jgi:hypothetical protein